MSGFKLTSPQARKTAVKKKAATAAEDGEEANGDQEGSEETKPVTPKKRAAATNAGKYHIESHGSQLCM